MKDYQPMSAGILRVTDPDRRQVIGRDGHLDQSPAYDLGQ